MDCLEDRGGEDGLLGGSWGRLVGGLLGGSWGRLVGGLLGGSWGWAHRLTVRGVSRKRLFLTIPSPVVGCLRKDVVRTCQHKGGDGPCSTISGSCANGQQSFFTSSVRPREALHMHETAMDSAVAQHGDDHQSVASCYGNIGNVYQVQGEYDEALVQHKKSLEI